MTIIPDITNQSSVSGIAAALQPVLNELVVAFPDHFAFAQAEQVETFSAPVVEAPVEAVPVEEVAPVAEEPAPVDVPVEPTAEPLG